MHATYCYLVVVGTGDARHRAVPTPDKRERLVINNGTLLVYCVQGVRQVDIERMRCAKP